VFAPLSPRRLRADAARELIAAVPAFVTCVGLFQDQGAAEVSAVLERVSLGLLQFHGAESAEYCARFGLPYVKAVSMELPDSLEAAEKDFVDARGLVLDSHEPGSPGGTGKTFDWTRIRHSRLPIVIAGGLSHRNVFEVVSKHRPWAVDVSSGVESRPGVKDPSLMNLFIQEVERGNRINT
jgi:phosphoribosylanthranilate isomerase